MAAADTRYPVVLAPDNFPPSNAAVVGCVWPSIWRYWIQPHSWGVSRANDCGSILSRFTSQTLHVAASASHIPTSMANSLHLNPLWGGSSVRRRETSGFEAIGVAAEGDDLAVVNEAFDVVAVRLSTRCLWRCFRNRLPRQGCDHSRRSAKQQRRGNDVTRTNGTRPTSQTVPGAVRPSRPTWEEYYLGLAALVSSRACCLGRSRRLRIAGEALIGSTPRHRQSVFVQISGLACGKAK